MKAKDTVVVCMSGGERIEGCSVRCHLAQAEISFKAGRELYPLNIFLQG